MNWNQTSFMVWDWGNLSPVCPNPIESSRSLPKPADAAVAANRHGSGTSSDVTFTSSSEVGHGSSKRSMSASSGSPFKQGKVLEFNFHAVSGEAGRFEDAGPSMPACHGEPLISLKLGKRTDFEEVCGREDVNNCATTGITSVSKVAKKTKFSVSQKSTRNSYCQVEGCNVDLSSAKDYHRKHRVCEAHSKAPKVVVTGLERRFCQQCSRLHALAEFDQNKRSCRRRLSRHNARRRKPQTDAIPFGSSRLSTVLYNYPRQQTHIFFNHWEARSNAVSSSDNLEGFKFTEAMLPLVKSTKVVGFDETHFSTSQISNTVVPRAVHQHNLDGLMPFKGTDRMAFNKGVEASAVTSNLNRAPVAGRALSLLSSDSGPSVIQQPSSHAHAGAMPSLIAANPVMHELDSVDGGFWQDHLPLAGASQFQAFRHL